MREVQLNWKKIAAQHVAVFQVETLVKQFQPESLETIERSSLCASTSADRKMEKNKWLVKLKVKCSFSVQIQLHTNLW